MSRSKQKIVNFSIEQRSRLFKPPLYTQGAWLPAGIKRYILAPHKVGIIKIAHIIHKRHRHRHSLLVNH
jgi:hypothetical protein